MLVEKIKKWLNSNSPPVSTIEIRNNAIESAVEEFRGAIIKHFLDRNKRTGDAVLSASGIGKCTRQSAYYYHGFEGKPLEARARVTMFVGDVYESLVKLLIKFSGEIVENEQKEINVRGIPGHIDFTHNNVLFDNKSMSAVGFKIEQESGIDDTFGYKTQISLYADGMKLPARHIIFNKNTGEMEEISVSPDPSLIAKAERKVKIIKASSKDKLPPRDFSAQVEKGSGRLYLGVECQYCAFKTLCWDITETKHIKGTYTREYVR